MHIYQQLPSLEWKVYPNVLRENLALGNYSGLLKQKYLSKDNGSLLTCRKPIFKGKMLPTHINFVV